MKWCLCCSCLQALGDTFLKPPKKKGIDRWGCAVTLKSHWDLNFTAFQKISKASEWDWQVMKVSPGWAGFKKHRNSSLEESWRISSHPRQGQNVQPQGASWRTAADTLAAAPPHSQSAFTLIYWILHTFDVPLDVRQFHHQSSITVLIVPN